jgi:hypothetical protein
MRLDSFSLANDINLAHSTHTYFISLFFSKLSFLLDFFFVIILGCVVVTLFLIAVSSISAVRHGNISDNLIFRYNSEKMRTAV